MRFRIPGKSIHVRIFEPVATTNDQYYVYDTGLDYENGKFIDSIAVGGSFATLEKLATKADEDSLKKRAKKAKKQAKKEAAMASTEVTESTENTSEAIV